MYSIRFHLFIFNNFKKINFNYLCNISKKISQSAKILNEKNNTSINIGSKNEDNKIKKFIVEEKKIINSSKPTGLMEFFDDPKNWNEDIVKTGRSWKLDELRLKSNSDLHKLWFILYKEKNMLLTMQAAYKRENAIMPSEERINKVEDSMENLEKVVKERNKAYWQLEVDHKITGTRPYAFRKDVFGRYRWISCSEHLVPYTINKGWRTISGEGTGKDVSEFMKRFKEKLRLRRTCNLYKEAFHVRQILRRFPNVDINALKLKYPKIDVEKQKDLLDEDYKLREIIPNIFMRYR